MAWVKGGDTAPTHPVALAVLAHPDADERSVNELFGFVMRCAMASTAHDIEYIVPVGTAVMMAGGHERAKALIDQALKAGYFTRGEVDGNEVYNIVEDDKFIHLIRYDERAWRQQQQNDRNNKSLVLPVRLRDGDGCRYCQRIVQWGSNRSGLAGTYDHLVPGSPATVDTYVVACKSCNSKMGTATEERRRSFLKPVPLNPYFSKSTVDFLRGQEWIISRGITVPDPTPGNFKAGDYLSKTSIGSQSVKISDGPLGQQVDGPVFAPASEPSADGPLGRQSDGSASAPASAGMNDTLSESDNRPIDRPGSAEGHASVDGPLGQQVDGPVFAPASTHIGVPGPLGRQSDGSAPAPAGTHERGRPGGGGTETPPPPAKPQHPPETGSPPGETVSGKNRASFAQLSGNVRADQEKFCANLPEKETRNSGNAGSGRVGSGTGRAVPGNGRAVPGRAGAGSGRAGTGRAGSGGHAVVRRRKR